MNDIQSWYVEKSIKVLNYKQLRPQETDFDEGDNNIYHWTIDFSNNAVKESVEP